MAKEKLFEFVADANLNKQVNGYFEKILREADIKDSEDEAFLYAYVTDTIPYLPTPNLMMIVSLFKVAMLEYRIDKLQRSGDLSQKNAELVSSLTTAKGKEITGLGLDAKSLRANRKSVMGDDIFEIIEKGGFDPERAVGSIASVRKMLNISPMRGVNVPLSKKITYLNNAKLQD